MNESIRTVTNHQVNSTDPFEQCSFTGEYDDSDDSENEDSKLKKEMENFNYLDDSCKIISNDLNKLAIDEIKYKNFTKKLTSILNELKTIDIKTFPLLRGVLEASEQRVKKTMKRLDLLHEKNCKIPQLLEDYVKNSKVTPEREKVLEYTTLENLISQDPELREMINNFPNTSCSVENFQGNRKYFCDIPFSTEYLRTSQKQEHSMIGANETFETYSESELTQPIQLVLKDTGGKYALNDEPIRRIVYREDVINKKLVVVSVTGLSRCGKSCVLKLIYKFFKSKETEDWATSEDDTLLKDLKACECSESHTKGILMWPVPIIIDDLAVILLDTQSTISVENDGTSVQETAFISALSTMLSSIQICNVANMSHMDQLSHVKVFLEYGKLIMQEYGVKAFQKLTFLVRDSPITSFGMSGGQKFLNDWMKERQKTSDTDDLFDMITSCFDTISCYRLPHPAHSHKVTSEGLNGNIGDLDPIFKHHITNFVETNFSRKQLLAIRNGREEIRAHDWLAYARMSVIELQKLKPQGQSMLEELAGLKHIKYVQSSLKFYEQKMENLMPKTEDIDALHKEVKEEAVQIYNSVRKFGGENVTSRYRDALLKEIAERYDKGVMKFKEDREIAREELREDKMRAAKNIHKRKINAFLERKDYETSFAEKNNSLRVQAIKYFITEVAGKITEHQQDACIKKLDRRLQEYYKSHLDEYNSQCAVATAKNRDDDCNTATKNAISNYLKTMNAVKDEENISKAHINAKNQEFEKISELKSKYKDHNIQPYLETLNSGIDNAFEKFKIEHERKMHDMECEMKNEFQTLSREACEKYIQLMEIYSHQNSNAEEIKEIHETCVKTIQSDYFTPLISKFGQKQCKPIVKHTKKELKRAFKELKKSQEQTAQLQEHTAGASEFGESSSGSTEKQKMSQH